MDKQMINPKSSLFHIYSLGYVVETNHKDCYCKSIIKVLPLEYLSNEEIATMLYKIRTETNAGTTDVDIKSFVNNEKIQMKVKKIIDNSSETVDWETIDETVKVERQRWLPATWMDVGKNNEYNPTCVNRGDLVVLYKYGDMNNYFWRLVFRRSKDEHQTADGSIKKYVSSDIKNNKINKEVVTSSCTNSISYKIHCKDYTTNVFNYLNMENGEYNYIDNKGNVVSIDQKGDIHNKATANYTAIAGKNMYLVANSKMDLAPSNMLSIVTKDVITKVSNGVSISAGNSYSLKATTITLQGNVVLNGNLVVTGSVVPASCPCCCLCPAGGGGGGSVPSAQPDNGYQNAKKQCDSILKDNNSKRQTYLDKIKQFSTEVLDNLKKKVGTGN